MENWIKVLRRAIPDSDPNNGPPDWLSGLCLHLSCSRKDKMWFLCPMEIWEIRQTGEITRTW